MKLTRRTFLQLLGVSAAGPAIAKLPHIDPTPVVEPEVVDFSDFDMEPPEGWTDPEPMAVELDLSGYEIDQWSVSEQVEMPVTLWEGPAPTRLPGPTHYEVEFTTHNPELGKALTRDFMGQARVRLKLVSPDRQVKVLATGVLQNTQHTCTFDQAHSMSGTMQIYDDNDVRFLS